MGMYLISKFGSLRVLFPNHVSGSSPSPQHNHALPKQAPSPGRTQDKLILVHQPLSPWYESKLKYLIWLCIDQLCRITTRRTEEANSLLIQRLAEKMPTSNATYLSIFQQILPQSSKVSRINKHNNPNG